MGVKRYRGRALTRKERKSYGNQRFLAILSSFRSLPLRKIPQQLANAAAPLNHSTLIDLKSRSNRFDCKLCLLASWALFTCYLKLTHRWLADVALQCTSMSAGLYNLKIHRDPALRRHPDVYNGQGQHQGSKAYQFLLASEKSTAQIPKSHRGSTKR